MIHRTASLAIAAFLVGAAVINAAELSVSHPGPVPDEYKLKEEHFTAESGLRAWGYLDKFLLSFARLTELIETKTRFRRHLTQSDPGKRKNDNIDYSVKLSLKELRAVENLDWETQYLGFHNHSVTLKGTLLLQQARIRELEYELLKLQKAGEDALQKARKEAAGSRRLFDEFKDNQSWVD